MLSTSERNYLLSSMKGLLEEYYYDYSSSALEDIIDEWASQKAGLIEAFKKHPNYLEGQFMIAFDADYERKIDGAASRRFYNWLEYNVMQQYKDNLPQEIKDRMYSYQYLPEGIYDFFYYLHHYAERCISESTAAYLNTHVPEIHAHAGQKTSRVVNKLCCYLGYDKADGYNREFAKYADSLSPMVIKRHTILSINPLDYLTMSFGNSWASCHTIDKTNKRGMPNSYSGCYSSGTISYMLDKVSMVLYTVDAGYDGDEYWDQPKINRQMFHYGEEKLIQGRLYPQDNDRDDSAYVPYRNIVQQIIATIFDFPNLWILKKGTSEACRYVSSEGTHYRDYRSYSNCSLSRLKGSENEEWITIGARPICVTCGRRHLYEQSIVCCENSVTCADCGCVVDEDDTIYIDGEYYCRDCCHYCEHCEEYHRGHSTYLARYNRYVCDRCLDEDFCYCEHCDEYVREEDMYWVECENRYVCSHCIDDDYSYCEDCGEYFPTEDTHEYHGMTLCENCYDERREASEEEEVC
jgi:hypothetical protein